MTVPADTAQFESFVAGNKQLVEEFTEKAKAGGCTSHLFAVGEGQIIVVDQWESAEQFQAFIGSPEVQRELLGPDGSNRRAPDHGWRRERLSGRVLALAADRHDGEAR